MALLLGAAAGTGTPYQRAPNPAHERARSGRRCRRQHLTEGARVPGFWLPDGRGGLVRTAPYKGKVLLIYLFAADVLTAAALPRARRAGRRTGPAACSQSRSASRPIGVTAGCWRGRAATVPVAGDPSTINVTAPPQSAIAVAYNAQLLPLLAIADRRRKAREVLTAEPFYELAALRHLVKPRLDAKTGVT